MGYKSRPRKEKEEEEKEVEDEALNYEIYTGFLDPFRGNISTPTGQDYQRGEDQPISKRPMVVPYDMPYYARRNGMDNLDEIITRVVAEITEAKRVEIAVNLPWEDEVLEAMPELEHMVEDVRIRGGSWKYIYKRLVHSNPDLAEKLNETLEGLGLGAVASYSMDEKIDDIIARVVGAIYKTARVAIVTDINWDTYDEELGEDVDIDLPDTVKVEVPDDWDEEIIDDQIANLVSDEVGWLINSCNWDWE